MKIASTIHQVRENKSQNQNAVKVGAVNNAASNGTNNNANNNAAVAQSTVVKTDTVTLSKKSVALASKTATKSEPNVEKAFGRQSDEENVGHGSGGAINSIGDAGEGSGNSNAVSLFSLSNNINAALESYRDVQKAEMEPKEAIGVLA